MLPLKWAIVPASALLLNSIITTIIQVRTPSENYAKHVVPGRASAQIPSTLTGLHGPVPSSEPLVVFNLGTQPNHPLGIFAPGWQEMGDYFSRMSTDLQNRKDEYGLISMSGWRAGDRPTNNSMLLTFYFRNVEGLNKFAHDKLHREAWDGYYKSAWQKNIGIYHETFIVRPGDYETLYVNTSPVLLGRGMIKAETKDGERYVNTLVGADVPALKTQWARLGRDSSGAKTDLV